MQTARLVPPTRQNEARVDRIDRGPICAVKYLSAPDHGVGIYLIYLIYLYYSRRQLFCGSRVEVYTAYSPGKAA